MLKRPVGRGPGLRVACLTLVLAATPLLAPPAQADQSTTHYAVTLLGVPVGAMSVTQSWSGATYAAASAFHTTGVVALVRDVGFEMQSEGQREGQHLRPERYRERVNTGERTSNGEVTFAGGDRRQGPNSAMVEVLSDRPLSQGCGFHATIFDGEREHDVRIAEGSASGGTYVCHGQMLRTKGYSAEELAQRNGYSFTVTYAVDGDQLRFAHADVSTQYGPARVSRQ